MSKAKELLLECKIKLGVKTDYKLAQELKIERARISDYMAEKRTPDTYACVRIALILNRNPAEIIAIVEEESEKNAQRKSFWADFLLRAKQAAQVGTLLLIFTIGAAGNINHGLGGFKRKRYFA